LYDTATFLSNQFDLVSQVSSMDQAEVEQRYQMYLWGPLVWYFAFKYAFPRTLHPITMLQNTQVRINDYFCRSLFYFAASDNPRRQKLNFMTVVVGSVFLSNYLRGRALGRIDLPVFEGKMHTGGPYAGIGGFMEIEQRVVSTLTTKAKELAKKEKQLQRFLLEHKESVDAFLRSKEDVELVTLILESASNPNQDYLEFLREHQPENQD